MINKESKVVSNIIEFRQAERVRAARNAMCKSPKPASEYRQWKLSDSPSGKKNNDRLFPNIHEKQTPK